MSEYGWVSIVWAAGALVLALSALAAHQLNWRSGIKYALIWGCVFFLVALVFNAVGA